MNGQPKKKKKKKKKQRTANPRKRKRKRKRTANPGKRKKKVKSGQKLRLILFTGPYVCLITKMSLSYELWKLKTAKSCFQFP